MSSERDEIVAQVKKEILEDIYVHGAQDVMTEIGKTFERSSSGLRAAWSINVGYKTTA